MGGDARFLAVGVLLTAESVVADLLLGRLGVEEVLTVPAVVQLGIRSRQRGEQVVRRLEGFGR